MVKTHSSATLSNSSYLQNQKPVGTSHKESFREYDICVITAANAHQAQGYETQLQWRKSTRSLPEETDFLVFTDPQGKRIGSGGSTIYTLYKLLQRFCRNGKFSSLEQPFRGKRILILHSGGDSRRLPAYSAVGKISTPLPIESFGNGFIITLFDVFFSNLMELPSLDNGQVIVASGDVLVSFDASEVTFSDWGVTGLAYPGSVDVAFKHGVYIAHGNRLDGNLVTVADFLQKPTYEELENCDGLDAAGRAYIDTGIMNFAVDAVQALMEASGLSFEDGEMVVEKNSVCENLMNAEIQLDIYREIPFSMLGKSEADDFSLFNDRLQEIAFSVCLLPYCEFFHVGMSKQLLQSFHSSSYTASVYGFQNFSKSRVPNKSVFGNAFVYNSFVDTSSVRLNGPCLIEGCYLEGEVLLEGENILTGVPKGTGDIRLRKGVCATCVPVYNTDRSENGWVSIIYGINDSFKELAGDNNATFLNEPLLDWMRDKGISSSKIWPESESQDLWNALLFPFSTDPKESMQILQGEFRVDKWREASRMSLRQILQAVDYERILNHYSDLQRRVSLASFAIEEDSPSDEVLSWCMAEEDYRIAVENVMSLIEESKDMLFQARLYRLLSNVLRRADGAGYSITEPGSHHLESSSHYEDIAFGLVRKAIGEGMQRGFAKGRDDKFRKPKIGIRSDEVVWVCAPARLDFAGGWSDTPPYCLEHGGSVLNAAVKLNGQYPIQAIGKIHPEPFIRISSIDLGEHVNVYGTPEMMSYQDPTSWSALPKAAFAVTGIMSEGLNATLENILRELGGGIDLTIFSAVPSGSGLGTSSILGSAIIACLSRMLGENLTQDELFNRTLYMEQLMTTGGGWQDQIGGLVGGVKHIETEPGLFQVPRISWTELRTTPDMDLSERFLLYYTGYRRMARGILREIVGKYLDRDVNSLQTIARLREISFEMKEELDHRDIDAFGRKIAEVWELNKALDPGTSNEDIEAILYKISHLILGAKLLGAGGGGFLFMVTRGVEETSEIRRILERNPPNDRARFFDFDIDQDGLRVSVL